MELLPTLGLLGLLLVKESGVPIPIPGDLLVIGAGIAAAAAAAALVVFAAIGGAGWVALTRRRKREMSGSAQDERTPRDLPTVGSWAEAACPACLAVSLIRSDAR